MFRRNAHNPRYVKLTGTVSIRLVVSSVLALGTVIPAVALPVGAVHANAPASVTGLKPGSTGDAVRSLQRALVDRGYSVAGGVDGVFGDGTKTALERFQAAQGLATTGTVTAATALALGLTTSPYLGLSAGSRGDAVRQLQEALIAKGITVVGGADGIFGPGTTEAVKQFQRNVGYYPSGQVNAATAVAIAQGGAGTASTTTTTGSTTAAASAGSDADRSSEAHDAGAGTTNLVGLKVGSTGSGVKELQELLQKAGVEVVGGADGVFGALTKRALTSYQSARGLSASGSVDQATVDALRGTGAAPNGVTNGSTDSGSTEIRGLRFGDTGAGVKRVQEALIGMGYTVRGGADGVYGRDTETAIKAFQTSNGFQPTGTITEATAKALETVLGSRSGTGADATANNGLIGLAAGAVGSDVKRLQEQLIAAGVSVRGGADGIFGPATTAAVKTFQTSQGLSPSGKVDEATAKALADPTPVDTDSGSTGEVGFPVYGEKGERVLALQAALVKAGISLRGGVDGDFGSGTVNAILEFQRQKGLSATGKLDQATADALGITASPAPVVNPAATSVSIDVFPTARPCGYADTWHFNRGGGRNHLGVDVIAPAGTPIYAVTDGKISKLYTDAPGSLSGNGVRLLRPDGTYFFYAHMTTLADGIGLGVPVKAGDVIGYVGNTGNTGGVNHLHFEVHPLGGSAVNPYPIVKAVDAC